MASYGCPSFLSHHAIHTHLYPWHFTIYCSLRYRTKLLTDVITSISLRCGQAQFSGCCCFSLPRFFYTDDFLNFATYMKLLRLNLEPILNEVLTDFAKHSRFMPVS